MVINLKMSSSNFNVSNFLLPGEYSIEKIDHGYLKKRPLTIYWTSMRLCWVYVGTDKMEFIRHNQIQAQFSSQPPKCLLKIDYLENTSSPATSIVFLFKHFEFREKLINLITPVVKKDDKNNQDSTSKASSSKNPEDSVTKPNISKMRVDEQSKLISPIEIKIRKALLAKNAPLANLHRDLVISGVLSEEEFWENRKNQLDDQFIQLTQPKAQSSGWVDIKAETNEGQGSKYTLTPEIIHSIFLQHPLVQKAYDENVPNNMTEESFWKRYFGSRYFHRNLNASQSGQSSTDELFDKLLEQDDAEAQSAASKFDHRKINRLIDLEASSGDRPDTGNRPDFTMVAGTDNKSLSLIRQFNQHSHQVLRNAKRKRDEEEGLAQETLYKEATLIEDLTAKKPVLEAPLRIESNSQYSQNHNQSDIEKQLTEQQNRKQKSKEFLNNNRQHFGFPINKYWHAKANKAASDHLTSILSKKASQASRHLSTESKPNEALNTYKNLIEYIEINLPPEVLFQASKEFETITELLRHFWSSLSCTPTAERSHKLERIINNIKGKDKALREWVGKMRDSEKPNQALYKYLIPLFNNTARAFKVYKTLTRNKSTPTH